MLVEHAKAYNAEVADTEATWGRIVDHFKDAAIQPGGPVEQLFSNLAGFSKTIENALKPSGVMLDDAVKKKQQELGGMLGALVPSAAGAAPMLEGAAPQFFTGSGGEDRPFWENARPSTNIEDRRGLGGGLEETNRQLKMLNDNLFQMLHPAGAAGGVPGGALGLLSGGGAGGGGGMGGGLGGAGNIDAGGGAAPYGSDVGAGTGAGAGETRPAGGGGTGAGGAPAWSRGASIPQRSAGGQQ